MQGLASQIMPVQISYSVEAVCMTNASSLGVFRHYKKEGMQKAS